MCHRNTFPSMLSCRLRFHAGPESGVLDESAHTDHMAQACTVCFSRCKLKNILKRGCMFGVFLVRIRCNVKRMCIKIHTCVTTCPDMQQSFNFVTIQSV